INAADVSDQAVLHECVLDRKVAMLRLLLDSGADVNKTGQYGMTPPMMAITTGDDTEILVTLLDAGADLEKRNIYGSTVLQCATLIIGDKPSDVICTLVGRGADFQNRLNARNNLGETALYKAACDNNIVAVAALLGAGAGVDLPDFAGLTPLCAAISRGHNDTASLLLEGGADR
ncbi:ankyrin, partial [Coniochaeta ligniaria NRRL 30616]